MVGEIQGHQEYQEWTPSGVFLDIVDFPIIWEIRGKSGKIDSGSESYGKSGESWEKLGKLGDFWGHQKYQDFFRGNGAQRGAAGLSGAERGVANSGAERGGGGEFCLLSTAD